MLEYAREKLKSYKNLPATYYQIGEKNMDKKEILKRLDHTLLKQTASGEQIKYLKDSTSIQGKTYYVREGYIISGVNGVEMVSGYAETGTTLATLQQKIVYASDEHGNTIETNTGDKLNNIIVATYGAVTNGGGVEAVKTWHYKLDWNGNEKLDDKDDVQNAYHNWDE